MEKRKTMTDREKLIELQKTICKTEKSCVASCFECMADHLIANGVTFAADNNVGRWIPVSERLPEEEELVLIICKNGKRSVGCYRRFNYNNEIMWGFKTELNPSIWLNKGRVTHWMPLPEPPKEECHEKENCLPRM